jgi:beta-glucosidase
MAWCTLLLLFASCTCSSVPDESGSVAASPTTRAAAMLARMTGGEKVGMMGGCDDKGQPDCLRPASGVGLTKPVLRLGIPALRLEDEPQGVGDWSTGVTMWPSALAVASSFDIALIQRWGAAVASEFRGKGMNVMLGPGINLARVPQNGRNYEYFGEDPWLAAELAKAEVRGVQSEGVIACAKHFNLCSPPPPPPGGG